MSPDTLVAVALLVCLAAGVQGTLGFGFAMVFAPLAAVVVDVDVAIATSILVGALVAMCHYVEVRPRAPFRTISPMLAGACAGLPLGLLLLASTSETALRLLVGVAVLVSAVLTFARRPAIRLQSSERLTGMVGAGVAGGLTLGAVSMNGPPVLVYLHWTGMAVNEIRARMLGFLAFSSLAGVLIAAAIGVIDGDVMLLSLASVPGVAGGVLLARSARPRLTEAWFAKASMAVLVLTSMVAIGGALEALL